MRRISSSLGDADDGHGDDGGPEGAAAEGQGGWRSPLCDRGPDRFVPDQIECVRPDGAAERGDEGSPRRGEEQQQGRTRIPPFEQIVAQGEGDQARCEDEAPVDVGPDHGQDRNTPHPAIPPLQQEPGAGEEGYRKCLRPSGKRSGGNHESEQREHRRRSRPRLRAPAAPIEEPESRCHGAGVRDRDPCPTEQPMRPSEDQLSGPLLVQPGSAAARERERVDEEKVPRSEAELAGAHVIGEVDGAHLRQERRERRESPGEGGPGWVGPSAYGGLPKVSTEICPFGGFHAGILRGTIRRLLGRRGDTYVEARR